MQQWIRQSEMTSRSLLKIATLALVLAASSAHSQERQPVAQAMGQVAKQLFDLRPVPLKLDLMPFRTFDNGLGDCDDELRDRLIEALRIEQSDANNAIVERRIDVRLPLAQLEASDATARIVGRYGADPQGNVWTEVQVLGSDQLVIASLPRTTVNGLVCKGLRRTLADTADFAMRGRDSGLSVGLTRPDPRVGDLVSISLQNAGPDAKQVLCLNIAASGSAQVLTPLRNGAPGLPQRGMLTWPRDFAASGGPAGPLCFDREQADALACFGFPADLPPGLRKRWREAWPEGSDEPKDLSTAAAVELVGEALAASGAAPAFQRYQVRRGPSAGMSACGTPLPR
jgi:hypothetical protein